MFGLLPPSSRNVRLRLNHATWNVGTARLTHLKECEGDLYDARPEGEREGAGGAGPGVVVGDEGVDGGGADGHLLDGAEHRVEEAGHDGRVKAVLKKTNPIRETSCLLFHSPLFWGPWKEAISSRRTPKKRGRK